MTNYWEKLKEAYSFLHNNKQDKANDLFNEIYTELSSLDYSSDDNLKSYLISSILWLWEIFMKKGKFDKSLEYYELWNKITSWRDFNILFNLWVVYRNLWQEEKSLKILNEAKKIDSKNPNLLRFLKETNNDDENNNNSNEINPSFLSKIDKMLKEIK